MLKKLLLFMLALTLLLSLILNIYLLLPISLSFQPRAVDNLTFNKDWSYTLATSSDEKNDIIIAFGKHHIARQYISLDGHFEDILMTNNQLAVTNKKNTICFTPNDGILKQSQCSLISNQISKSQVVYGKSSFLIEKEFNLEQLPSEIAVDFNPQSERIYQSYPRSYLTKFEIDGTKYTPVDFDQANLH